MTSLDTSLAPILVVPWGPFPAPVEPASLGNHLPVALDWSKYYLHAGSEVATENEAQGPPDSDL